MLQSDPDRTRSKKVFVGREVADPSICTGAVDQGLTILSQTTWQDTKPSTKWQLELSGNDRLDKEGFYTGDSGLIESCDIPCDGEIGRPCRLRLEATKSQTW
jgi:hypothetical protein